MMSSSSHSNTIRLTLEILKRIPRHRVVSATEIHAQLQAAGIHRSQRTIQRQLEALTEQFDIERDERSKPYGYRWKTLSKGFSLPMLNEQESLLLALAQQYLQNLLPTTVMRSLDGFFEQAHNNLLPFSGHQLESEWLGKVRVVQENQPLLPAAIDADVFEAVTTALYRNLWLTVDYVNAAGKQSEIHVMPLGLAQQGPRLYLVCRYKDFDNERNLALHRIRQASVSGLSFKRPAQFNLRQYDEDGRFGFGEGQHIKLSFCISKVAGYHLLETPLSSDQQVDTHDAHYEITATVVDSGRLTWWLNGFGSAVWNVAREPIVMDDANPA